MKVCIVCQGSKNIREVELIEKIPGDPRGDSTYLWMDTDMCAIDRRLMKNKDWSMMAERAAKARDIREELDRE